MSKRDYDVVPNGERGGWDVKREGAERASGHLNANLTRWIAVVTWLVKIRPS